MSDKITLMEKRVRATEEELRKPITKESSLRNLVRAGILTEDGKVADPYKEVISEINKKEK